MPFDISKIPPATRKAFIQVGRRFGSKDTLAQADKTLNGLANHAAKLEDHGFGADDASDLKSAREGLISAGVSREDKRVDKKSTSSAFAGAMRDAQQVRLRARSVLKAANRVIAQNGGAGAEEAARSIDAVLGKGAVAGDDAETLATQLDQLRASLEDDTIKPVVASRGGPKAAADLKTQADALREAAKTTAVPRGTPEATETLDLLDGIIVSLARSARDAADAASKALGEPALLAAFELTELYGAGKAKPKTAGETGAPEAEVPTTDAPSNGESSTSAPRGAPA